MKKIFNLILCFFFIILFYSETLKAAEIEILLDIPGSGEIIKNHSKVSVHYRGFLEDGTEFDSSFRRNEPFTFQIGIRQVIPGWEYGIKGMKVHGKRTIKIPSEYAYGKNGVGDIIPPNATLIFEIEVLSIQEPSYKVIDSNQLLSMQDNDLIIVDIRSQKEWKNTGTIIDSKKITAFDEEGNFQSNFLESFQNIAGLTTKVVFVSKNGDISSILANGFAEQLDYKHIYSLKGGIQEWILLDNPITK